MPSEHRIVAVADLLGFTETVRSQSLETVVAGPIAFVRRCLRHSAHQSGWPASYLPTIAEISAQDRVGIAWFSDTILLYALSDSKEHAKCAVETAGWLQWETFQGNRTAMRIGIDYGEFYADAEGSVFVGKALVGAYHLEEDQDWVGGAFTPAAAARLVDVGLDDYIEEYNVRLKSGSQRLRALKWVAIPHLSNQLHFEAPAQALADAPREQIRESILRKWRNAKIFHDARCEICRLNPR